MRFWFLLALILVGCSPGHRGDSYRYLLPWRASDGTYALHEVVITTLSAPDVLKGKAAEIYFESLISDNGFAGPIARPRLTKSGDVYIPLDTASSTAIAVYAQMERLYFYEKQLGSQAKLSWPRKIGVQIHLRDPDSGMDYNNAHYFSRQDIITLLPYTLNGVSLSLNHGIVAHEHFHSHFQREVLEPLRMFGDIEHLDKLDFSKAADTNNMVLRTWNEGLADFFAVTYTGSPDIFGSTLPLLSSSRTLAQTLWPLMGAKQLVQIVNDANQPSAGMVGLSYGQGTLLARLMYRLANSGVEAPNEFLRRILDRLHEIPAVIAPIYGTRVMDIEEIVPILLQGFTPNEASCESMRISLSPTLLSRSFPTCSAR